MANTLLGTVRDTGGLKDVRSDVDQAFRFFDETLKAKEHSTQIKTRDLTGFTGFILGNTSFGILGTSTLGGTLPAQTTQRVINPNGIYYEALRETTFKDTSNTTATWDTTNFRWTFTTGQIIQTLPISKDPNITITNATIVINSSQITNPSNLTYQLSANGGANFETVTLGTQHVFTNTGTELILKITASGSAQIDIDDSDENSFPVEVKVNQ